jgi:1-aminocyclopropane-1-carboxylate deaminase
MILLTLDPSGIFAFPMTSINETGHIDQQEILSPAKDDRNIGISVLRLDQVHPVVSGNKWFKLENYLEDAAASGKGHIVTFGGAWSNHIIATAAICSIKGLRATGIIRGEWPAVLSQTLQKAQDYGMDLAFISREEYRLRTLPGHLREDRNIYIIEEGGYGAAGAAGAARILDHCDKQAYSHFICGVGSGTTLAGLINACEAGQQAIGIAVMKNPALSALVTQFVLPEKSAIQFSINHDYHFGGYARHTSSLIQFMNDFYLRTGIPSDFVYTAKVFYAVERLASEGVFARGSRILVLHTGGLQGNASLPTGTLIF